MAGDPDEWTDGLHQAGEIDEQSFALLFDRHRNRLRKVVKLRLDPRLRGRIDPSDVVQEAFLEERPSLRALPEIPYQAVLRAERRVTRDGMVSIDGNLYSVPDSTHRRLVEVQVMCDQVQILDHGKLVAVHPVLPGRGQRRVATGHRRYPPPGNAKSERESDRELILSVPCAPVARRDLLVYDQIARGLAVESGGQR